MGRRRRLPALASLIPFVAVLVGVALVLLSSGSLAAATPPSRTAFSRISRGGHGSSSSSGSGIGSGSSSTTTDGCDLYDGDWVSDPDAYPLYDGSRCPFADKEFNCQRNLRPDKQYLSYRWQPERCDLPRPNASEFLEQWRGKKLMFVGDSLSLNQWTSLVCFLHSVAPNAAYAAAPARAVVFPDHDVTVGYYHSLYLVDLESQAGLGRVLRLDTIDGGALRWWIGNDVLIFNTWHWWPRKGKDQPWDYIQMGNKTYDDMDRVEAFSKGLATWSKWVQANVDPDTTRVFFQSISPTHYHGSDWGQPNATTCFGQTKPVDQHLYPQDVSSWPNVQAVKKAVSGIRSPPVGLLDVTLLSQLRKDGHPSKFGLFPMDCSHWCIAGVPDTWNQLLLATLHQPAP